MSFIADDFLLENPMANYLYHEVATHLPIIDYHNHLSAKDIADHKQFDNITDIWLAGDHYKWRAMRAMGIDERYITGDATAEEQFLKWAEVVPSTLRNPLFHWTHLELKRYFGIDELLSPQNARAIYAEANQQLSMPTHSAVGLLNRMNVQVICTTDDPFDDLKYHQQIKEDPLISFKVLPTWRPDSLLAFHQQSAMRATIQRLGLLTGINTEDIDSYLKAIKIRHEYFHEMGCRLSDHGLNKFNVPKVKDTIIRGSFNEFIAGKDISEEEVESIQAYLILEMAKMDNDKGWVQQFHLGALRNANQTRVDILGADTGFDTVGDYPQAEGLAWFLDSLEKAESLPKTILYNLNPSYNEVFATMAGSFNSGDLVGKIQWGAAWWYQDQKDGIEVHLNILSNLGLLRPFVGMLTDSRSLLSFPRHEYFRRILCNVFGQDVEKGLIPNDRDLLRSYVEGICYTNAVDYFCFKQ